MFIELRLLVIIGGLRLISSRIQIGFELAGLCLVQQDCVLGAHRSCVWFNQLWLCIQRRLLSTGTNNYHRVLKDVWLSHNIQPRGFRNTSVWGKLCMRLRTCHVASFFFCEQVCFGRERYSPDSIISLLTLSLLINQSMAASAEMDWLIDAEIKKKKSFYVCEFFNVKDSKHHNFSIIETLLW